MLEVKVDENGIMVKASGTMSELLTDITLFNCSIYEKFDNELFRAAFRESMADLVKNGFDASKLGESDDDDDDDEDDRDFNTVVEGLIDKLQKDKATLEVLRDSLEALKGIVNKDEESKGDSKG